MVVTINDKVSVRCTDGRNYDLVINGKIHGHCTSLTTALRGLLDRHIDKFTKAETISMKEVMVRIEELQNEIVTACSAFCDANGKPRRRI